MLKHWVGVRQQSILLRRAKILSPISDLQELPPTPGESTPPDTTPPPLTTSATRLGSLGSWKGFELLECKGVSFCVLLGVWCSNCSVVFKVLLLLPFET